MDYTGQGEGRYVRDHYLLLNGVDVTQAKQTPPHCLSFCEPQKRLKRSRSIKHRFPLRGLVFLIKNTQGPGVLENLQRGAALKSYSRLEPLHLGNADNASSS